MGNVKIGINGFGRIGRNILRAFFEEAPKGLDIVAINDLSPIEASAFLLEHDTSHGHLGFDVRVEDSRIISKYGAIRYSSCESPTHIDWEGYGVDIVFECTGAFSQAVDAKQHLHSGAKKVIISAPSDGADITVVFGVNQNNKAASYWYQQGALGGDIDAQFLTGNRYEAGIGFTKNYVKALRFYELAAEKNHVEASFKLGQFYEQGIGTDENYMQAAKWYLQSANADYGPAEAAIGLAIIVVYYRNSGTIRVEHIDELKG